MRPGGGAAIGTQRHFFDFLIAPPDDTRQSILTACGLPDDGSVNPGAVDLNNLDDWAIFHQEVLS